MKNTIFLIALIMRLAYELEAAPFCWDATIATPASVDVAAITGPPAVPAGTHCEFTHAYGSSGKWTATMWPVTTYARATSACTTSSTKTCNAVSTPTATIAILPTVSSCYTGTTLTADTLTSQAQTNCPASYYFCKAAFTGTSGTTATGVTLSCSNTDCVNGASQLCSMVANTNQVLGCYTGQKVTTGTAATAWAKSICAPISSASAAYCQLDYRWSTTHGYYTEGSCVTTCTAVTIVQTGTIATVGTTCTASIYGNSLAVRNFSFANSLIVMVVSCMMSLFVF